MGDPDGVKVQDVCKVEIVETPQLNAQDAIADEEEVSEADKNE